MGFVSFTLMCYSVYGVSSSWFWRLNHAEAGEYLSITRWRWPGISRVVWLLELAQGWKYWRLRLQECNDSVYTNDFSCIWSGNLCTTYVLLTFARHVKTRIKMWWRPSPTGEAACKPPQNTDRWNGRHDGFVEGYSLIARRSKAWRFWEIGTCAFTRNKLRCHSDSSTYLQAGKKVCLDSAAQHNFCITLGPLLRCQNVWYQRYHKQWARTCRWEK